MAPSPGFRVLGRSEPGHGGQWKESHVPARDDERVGDTLEAADLHGEVIQTLGLALFLGPRRAAPSRDEVPELEIVSRKIVGALGELEIVPALRQAAHGDLEGSETPERRKEVGS